MEEIREEGVCGECGKKEADCKGTRRYLAETCHGVEEVIEYCNGLIERV